MQRKQGCTKFKETEKRTATSFALTSDEMPLARDYMRKLTRKGRIISIAL